MSEKKRKLFGTDGIRAVAGAYPLDAKTIYAVGLALGHSLKRTSAQAKVLIGRDTRKSGPWIGATLAAALTEVGVGVESAGVVPTPAVAYLARKHGFAAGVVISASHNPWADNGIKLFGGDGFKLADDVELAMEDEILAHAAELAAPDVDSLPQLQDKLSYAAEYIQFLTETVPGLNLKHLKLVADCANGASAAVASELFKQLGASQIELLHIAPDGENINAGCGALHPKHVAEEVVARKAQIGMTFDGDADRCMMATESGRVINGDAILLMVGRDLKERGLLTGNVVVATTMSNMGLEKALRQSGIQMLRADVGDRYVLEMMQQKQAALGGEQSGHILLPHLATTGDGMMTALVVLDLVARSGKSLDELAADLKVFPQVIVNVRVKEKKPLEGFPKVAEAIRKAEEELADSGRVVIRFSGTEPLARVMIEAESETAMKLHAEAIAAAIRAEIGE